MAMNRSRSRSLWVEMQSFRKEKQYRRFGPLAILQVGDSQLDDAPQGGERAGGKAGRGSEIKAPFVAAVSFNEQGHPMYLTFSMVSRFTSEAIGKWVKPNRAPRPRVRSVGVEGFAAEAGAGCLPNAGFVRVLRPPVASTGASTCAASLTAPNPPRNQPSDRVLSPMGHQEVLGMVRIFGLLLDLVVPGNAARGHRPTA